MKTENEIKALALAFGAAAYKSDDEQEQGVAMNYVCLLTWILETDISSEFKARTPMGEQHEFFDACCAIGMKFKDELDSRN